MTTTTTRAPRSALLLFGGGLTAAIGSFLPWARLPILSVTGVSTVWGIAAFVAGTLGVVLGYRAAREHPSRLLTRVIALVAAAVGVAMPLIVAGGAHTSLLEQRLDAHLAPHGLTAADVLGADGHPSLFDRFAPFARADAARLLDAVERSMTIRVGAGVWVTLLGGAAMAVGAVAMAARRQRHVSGEPDRGDMTTNTTSPVTGMTWSNGVAS